MDIFEDPPDERLIEDYLFSGYKPHNQSSTFDADQQFARPIEDEDLFCVNKDDMRSGDVAAADDELMPAESIDEQLEPSSSQFDFDDRPFRRLSDEPLCDTNADSPGKLFEDEASDPVSPPAEQRNDIQPQAPIDEIFLDDYSESGDAANSENIRPTLEKSYSKPAAPQLTPAQIKKKLFMERLKQQALAMQQKKPGPIKIGSGFGKDGTIELQLEHSKLVSDPSSKFIFNKLFNQSKKADESGSPAKCVKQSWESYKAMLRKQICAQKRKVWDSFQAPTDGYDEEEELVGTESVGGSDKEADEPEEETQAEQASDDECGDADEHDDEDNEDDVAENESRASEAEASSDDEADISESDLDDFDRDDCDDKSEKSEMDCAERSSDDSDDEVVTRRIRAYDDDEDDDEDNDCGNVGKFIDDEVEVDEE